MTNELAQRNLDTISRTQSAIDLQITGLNKLPVQLFHNPKFRPFFIQSKQSNVRETCKALFEYDVTNDFIYELAFYVRGSNYIYSSISSYTLSTFPNYIYRYDNWSSEDFYRDINSISKPIIRPAENVTISQKSNQRFITILYPLPLKSNSPYATLIVLIKEDVIKELMKNSSQDNEANTLIVDDKGQIITALNNNENIYSVPFQKFFRTLEGAGYKTTTLGDTEYFVSYINSSETGWKYILLTPTRSITLKIKKIQNRFLFSILFILIIGIPIIYYLMITNYNPIKQLKEFAEKKMPHNTDNSNSNEIEIARLTIANLADTSRSLEQRVQNSRDAVRNFLLLDLIKGNINTLTEFNEKGKNVGLAFRKDIYRVAIFLLYNKKNQQITETNKKDIIQAIENKLPNEIDGHGLVTVDQNKIIFILAIDPISDSLLKTQLLFFQQYIYEKWQISATIGVGNSYEEISQVGKSFIEASTAIDYQLIKGKNQVIFLNEVIEEPSNLSFYPKKELENLELAILQGDINQIADIVVDLIRGIKENNMPLFIAKCLCFDIINTVIKITFELSQGRDVLQTDYPDVMSLTEFQTVEEMAEIVQRISFDLCNYILENKETNDQKLMEHIYSYIDENYLSFNFSVQGMADELGMSPSNLSHYFKAQTGQTISDHIGYLRIEKAKELLKASDQPLKKIVEKIGYSDVSSFIKKFKENTGMTPGAYRRL